MPADLRIANFVTDPEQPEAGQPVAFMVECANVGDEGTGAFVVRFELDQAENIELPVDTVAAGETQWVRWPHDVLSQGNHHIYCLLDADHAVPEPEEKRNQQSIYFKVGEIEKPPQDADGDAYYDDNAMANAVISSITGRVNLWLTLSVQAVEEWEVDAKAKVAEYNDADASVDAAPAVLAFAKAVVKYVPGVSTGLGVIEDVGGFIDLVQTYMGNQYMGLAGARARLTAAIDEVQAATGKSLRDAINGHEGRLRAHLSPNNADSPLIQVDSGSTDPEYIAELVDWLGVPQPNEQNTTEPIKQEMMEGFEKVMWEVNRQLQKEAGI